MYTNRNLDKSLRKLSESCADLIDQKLSDPNYMTRSTMPEYKNSQLVGTRTEDHPDYCRILHDVENNNCWKDCSYFTISKNILKTDVKHLCGGGLHDDSPDNFARKQLALFIAQLAKDGGHRSLEKFRITLSSFHKHLNNNPNFTTYVAPLYNINGEFSTIRLTPNLCVRKVTSREHSEIVKLNHVPLREIPLYRRRLNFVLSCSMQGSSSKDLIRAAISEYSLAVSLFKLFKRGYPQFGRMYKVKSEHLEVGLIEHMSQSYYENPSATGEIWLKKSDARRFGVFYNTVIKKLNNAHSLFLRNAITRFSMAYIHRIPANKIIDYVISLEALLTSGPGESSLKLAHRTTALYADDDATMVDTWEFIKQVYNFRSGMVHTSKERPIKVRSSILSIDDAESKLYKITRCSIRRMIEMVGSYKNQDEILRTLDRSIYCRKELRELRNTWKPIQSYCR